MLLKNRSVNRALVLRLGLLSFLLSTLIGYFGPRTGLVSENWIDGIHGFFLGAAIALMLLSLRLGRGGRSVT
jgi:hypothetical protein